MNFISFCTMIRKFSLLHYIAIDLEVCWQDMIWGTLMFRSVNLWITEKAVTWLDWYIYRNACEQEGRYSLKLFTFLLNRPLGDIILDSWNPPCFFESTKYLSHSHYHSAEQYHQQPMSIQIYLCQDCVSLRTYCLFCWLEHWWHDFINNYLSDSL